MKYSNYNLSEHEINSLYECGIINGCGGKGGANFDKILKDSIKILPGFDIQKGAKLYLDIREVCFEHDIEFRFKIGFYKANFRFAKKIYLLLQSWAGRKNAFCVGIIAFILLCKHGKEFYNKN